MQRGNVSPVEVLNELGETSLSKLGSVRLPFLQEAPS
jgi:hypothetical protein